MAFTRTILGQREQSGDRMLPIVSFTPTQQLGRCLHGHVASTLPLARGLASGPPGPSPHNRPHLPPPDFQAWDGRLVTPPPSSEILVRIRRDRRRLTLTNGGLTVAPGQGEWQSHTQRQNCAISKNSAIGIQQQRRGDGLNYSALAWRGAGIALVGGAFAHGADNYSVGVANDCATVNVSSGFTEITHAKRSLIGGLAARTVFAVGDPTLPAPAGGIWFADNSLD